MYLSPAAGEGRSTMSKRRAASLAAPSTPASARAHFTRLARTCQEMPRAPSAPPPARRATSEAKPTRNAPPPPGRSLARDL